MVTYNKRIAIQRLGVMNQYLARHSVFGKLPNMCEHAEALLDLVGEANLQPEFPCGLLRRAQTDVEALPSWGRTERMRRQVRTQRLLTAAARNSSSSSARW